MSHPAEALDDPVAPAHVWASLAIDLQTPEGRDVIYRLVPEFDVVLINYRTGVPARLGVGGRST